MAERDEVDDILDELGIDVEAELKSSRTPREERIIAGFEDIVRFVEKNGRPPRHAEDGDIFERMYAVRLDRLREQDDCLALLAPMDTHGLLAGGKSAQDDVADLSEDDVLAALGLDGDDDLTTLTHVKSRAEVKAAEEIATREKCKDFARFKPLFEKVQSDLDRGIRQARKPENEVKMTEFAEGSFFIIGGQYAYVAEAGESFRTEYDRADRRLRVVYDNGTEHEILARSLQRSMYKDELARFISEPAAGPLFATEPQPGEVESGTIYVLRTKSQVPYIAERRHLIHKIGFTKGSVEKRIAHAATEATFLFAEAEIAAEYKLYSVSKSTLEAILHRFFEPARLKITIPDRFGRAFVPEEWFEVPIEAIDEAIQRVQDGSIITHFYDPGSRAIKTR